MWQTGVFIWTISDYFSRVMNAVASAMCELFNLLEKYPFFLRRRVTTSLWAQYAAVIVCIMGSLFKCPSTILPTGIDIILFTECMVSFREPMKSITMLQVDLLWYNLITVLQCLKSHITAVWGYAVGACRASSPQWTTEKEYEEGFQSKLWS